MKNLYVEAATVALQVLEAIRGTHPQLIADNMPTNWGMNALRESLSIGVDASEIKGSDCDSAVTQPPQCSDEGTKASKSGPDERTHELYIKIAADDIASLRKVDVFRVLESIRADNIDGVSRASLALWITVQRPDLSEEVADVLEELAN